MFGGDVVEVHRHWIPATPHCEACGADEQPSLVVGHGNLGEVKEPGEIMSMARAVPLSETSPSDHLRVTTNDDALCQVLQSEAEEHEADVARRPAGLRRRPTRRTVAHENLRTQLGARRRSVCVACDPQVLGCLA